MVSFAALEHDVPGVLDSGGAVDLERLRDVAMRCPGGGRMLRGGCSDGEPGIGRSSCRAARFSIVSGSSSSGSRAVELVGSRER